MNPFAKGITDLIKKDVAEGKSLKEALNSVGAKKWAGDNTYYIPYGTYQDKVLIFKVS